MWHITGRTKSAFSRATQYLSLYKNVQSPSAAELTWSTPSNHDWKTRRLGTKKLMILNPTASSSRLLQECPSVLYVYHTRELCLNSWTGSRRRFAMHGGWPWPILCHIVFDGDLHPPAPGNGQFWWGRFGPLWRMGITLDNAVNFRHRKRQTDTDGRCQLWNTVMLQRVRLLTQIRKNSWDPRTDADGTPPKICGCGLTGIINSSSALGKLTRWAQWADAIDALYLSHPRDHTPQLQPLIVLQWPSLPGSDGLDTRLWLGACVGNEDCRL